jgi:quercetin dioxygenase-like cupin family protein
MEKVNESEREYRNGDSGVKYLFRGPKIDWGVLFLHPGQSMAAHYHNEVEEIFYVVEGQAAFYIDDVKHELVAGDAVRLVPPERHAAVNESERPVKLVFIKCPYLPQDKVST